MKRSWRALLARLPNGTRVSVCLHPCACRQPCLRARMETHGWGTALHFHAVDGVLIKDCFFTGTLRPTPGVERASTSV